MLYYCCCWFLTHNKLQVAEKLISWLDYFLKCLFRIPHILGARSFTLVGSVRNAVCPCGCGLRGLGKHTYFWPYPYGCRMVSVLRITYWELLLCNVFLHWIRCAGRSVMLLCAWQRHQCPGGVTPPVYFCLLVSQEALDAPSVLRIGFESHKIVLF